MTLHKVGDFFRNVVANVTPQSQESKFISEGKLTPDEFVEAGEELVHKFPAWQWGFTDSRHRASWLPADKQYLITRNVPCTSRVRDLDYSLNHNTKVDEDWLVAGDEKEEAEVAALEQDVATLKVNNPVQEVNLGLTAADDEEAIDMSEFKDMNELLPEDEDNGAALSTGLLSSSTGEIVEACAASKVSARRYDLTITYDKYYQTPRLWLLGFSEDGKPLQPKEVYEDVLSEYATKTVTVDTHPTLGIPAASIHPCRHAQVMKKVVDGWIQNGKDARSAKALFVFLKFMSSVIPTIDYDCTMDVDT